MRCATRVIISRGFCALGAFLLALTASLFGAPAAHGEPFPSNAELASKNVGLRISGFDFTSGMRKGDDGKIDCDGLDLYETNGWASGFIIKPDGTLITNYHAARRARSITALFQDGAAYRVNHLLLYSRDYDLAVLKISGDRTFGTASLGDSRSVQPQDQVLAVGNPQGLGLSVSPGVVSQVMKTDTGQEYRILHTAAMAPGNSGGALYKGKNVIGVNVAKVLDTPGGGGSGFNLAIPINKVKEMLPKAVGPASYDDVFPPDPNKISQKRTSIAIYSGNVPPVSAEGKGWGVPFDMEALQDLLLILKTQSEKVKLLVLDREKNILGCGHYYGRGITPLLFASDYAREVFIAAVNLEESPVDVQLEVFRIDW